jgi:ribosomal protein S18 acetylase RimI-like enzyme
MTDTSRPPAFILPEALLSRGIALRRETDADLPFLLQVYASTRTEELKLVPWSEEQKRAFLIQQFGAQRHHYRTYFPETAFDVIEQHGRPIGRLYLHERQTRVSIIDIALLPDHRQGGIGTAIITALQEQAAARGKGLAIFVERNNPARMLYERLGFTVIREEDVHLEMDWTPEGIS